MKDVKNLRLNYGCAWASRKRNREVDKIPVQLTRAASQRESKFWTETFSYQFFEIQISIFDYQNCPIPQSKNLIWLCGAFFFLKAPCEEFGFSCKVPVLGKVTEALTIYSINYKNT